MILKKLRSEAQLSQMQVANWLGLAHPTYNRKENGKIPITLDELITLLGNYKRHIAPNQLTPIVLEIFGLDNTWTPEKEATGMNYADDFIAQLKAENKRLLETIAELKDQLHQRPPFEQQQPSREPPQKQTKIASRSHMNESDAD